MMNTIDIATIEAALRHAAAMSAKALEEQAAAYEFYSERIRAESNMRERFQKLLALACKWIETGKKPEDWDVTAGTT